jgi:transposase
MASNSELALMTKLLDIEGMKVKNYSLIAGIGVLIYLESQDKKVPCPHCGKKTDKLHQNRELRSEIYLALNGQKNYCAVLVDLDQRVIVGILPKRTKEEVRKHLESWGEEVLGQIEEVSIDLWKPYQTVVGEVIPHAEIVADRFHVMKQINDELDEARRKAKRKAKKIKKKTERESVKKGLTKSKYVLLKNESELSDREQEKLKEVREVAPELGKMHQLKEEFRKIFEDSSNWKEGLLSFGDWLTEASEYFPKSSKTIRRWIGEIIPYFDHRTSQGVVEGINNKIKLIKRRAFGFRNFDNFRIRCFVNWHFAC